jgi:hypothetical protein
MVSIVKVVLEKKLVGSLLLMPGQPGKIGLGDESMAKAVKKFNINPKTISK